LKHFFTNRSLIVEWLKQINGAHPNYSFCPCI